MKIFLRLWGLIRGLIPSSSNNTLVDNSMNYRNPFSTQAEISTFTISATTGLSIPFTQAQLSQADKLRNIYAVLSTKQGMSLNTPSYRQAYLKADPCGAQGRIRIAERIGDAGAQAYAQKLNFKPLYQGRPGQGQGFDAVFRHGKQVVVVEAKGGSSQPAIYRGYKQGTLEYTLKVAEYVKNSKNTSVSAKAAADEVIKAAKEKRLVIQVTKTQHVYGTPEHTQVQTTYGKIDLPSPLSIAHDRSVRIGLGGATITGVFDLVAQLSSSQPIDWKRVATMSTLGGMSAYAGSMSGIAMQRMLSSNRSVLLAKLSSSVGNFSGGIITSALFTYGLYFLGYANLTDANRSMVVGTAGSLAGIGASMGLVSLAVTIGTASTGTAISGLSGAAATNAAMAWLGGGALSAGGFGMLGGAILTGGVGLVAAGIGAGIMYHFFKKRDEKANRKRIKFLITHVRESLDPSVE